MEEKILRTKPPTKVVVFDLDGTLIPTMQGFADIAASVICEVHSEWDFARARQAYLDTSGIPFFQQLKVIFPAGVNNAAVAAEFERRKEVFSKDALIPEENILALRELRRRGFGLAVSSNNFERLVKHSVLQNAGDVFDEICGYRDGFAKGREHFAWLQAHFDVKPAEMLFIGDSLSDMRAAMANSIAFMGVLGTFSETEFRAIDPKVRLLQTVAQLPSLLLERDAWISS
jgi:phosphoglycolate phosphatase-like HAD superfamily hydrolase